MTFRLRFIIKGLPRMANGGHGSWQRTAGERKKWKSKVARELAGLAPDRPFTKIRAVFIRRSFVEPDYDGLVHGFKAIRDALVRYAFVVNDRTSNIEAVYRWEKAPQGGGHIEVEITGLEP